MSDHRSPYKRVGQGGGGRKKPPKKSWPEIVCPFMIALLPLWPVFLAVYYVRRAIDVRRGATSPRPATPHRTPGGAPGGTGAGPITGSGRHPHTGVEVS